jgi:REP element-mobilizing transposase RayT
MRREPAYVAAMRKPRVWEAGGIYHLAPNGNAGREVFVDDVDRQRFLAIAAPLAAKHEVLVVGYCLMGNHLHLIVVAGPGGLSRFMQTLLSRYSRWFNRRHSGEGHVFENHFHAVTVEDDSHLRAALRYVDLNPVEVDLVDRPEEWRWSSYRAHVGLERPAPLLANAEFVGYFGPTPKRAMEAYRRFVEDKLVS